MATGSISRWAKIRAAADHFFHEKGIESDETFARSRLGRLAHFCLMVGKSFQRNRCPVRASALAYTTLLALVPLLAVAVGITTTVLKKQGKQPIYEMVDKLVDYVAPALNLQPKAPGDPTRSEGREEVVNKIMAFIEKINAGALSTTSALALLFVGISLLRTIEATFNDIWGVTHGRSWVKSVVYYWAAITLGPVFLAGALALTTGKSIGYSIPFVGALVHGVMPFVILSIGFAVFYALVPNTRVSWMAALIGGIIGGCLWQVNNLFSVIYVSRVVSYTNLYGSLSVLPLFLVGLYFSWLIVLLGAQVAYAYQNREAYIEEKQAESVNQRGREFVALRLMTYIADRFLRGEKPATLVQISCDLGVPSALVCKLLTTFVKTGLLVEVADGDTAYSPGRPVDRTTAHDVIRAIRAGQGIELATKEDPWRTEVRAEFERILDAERQTGRSTTLAMLAEHRSPTTEVAR